MLECPMKEVKKMKRQAFWFEIPQKRRGLKRNITLRKKNLSHFTTKLNFYILLHHLFESWRDFRS